jgi:hypothetical protein
LALVAGLPCLSARKRLSIACAFSWLRAMVAGLVVKEVVGLARARARARAAR